MRTDRAWTTLLCMPRKPLRVAAALVMAILLPRVLVAERQPVRLLTTADGLPRDQLQCVRSDARGFVWFCTAEGLARFDGHVAVTFGRDQGLNPPGVRSFLNATGDRYFVGTDWGLFILDAGPVHGTGRFRALARDDGQPVSGVNALEESRDRTIWCGTGRGLLHLSYAGGRPHLVEVDIGLPRKIEDDQIVKAVLEDERGVLWVGAGSGLYARRPDGHVTRVTVAHGLPANDILTIALDADRRLWAGTRDGLVLLDRDAIYRRDARVVRHVFTKRDGLPDSNVRAIHVAGQTLWIATVLGIAEASLTSTGDLRVQQTLVGFFAWAITTDLRGDVWAATEAGARKLLRRGFVTYSTEDGLPVRRASSLFETARGQVCATTQAPRLELSCFDEGGFKRIRVRAADAIGYLGFGWSQLTLQDRQGGWWIPTGEGLLRFPPGSVSSLSAARPTAIYGRRHGFRSDNVFRLFEDSRGGIWVATYAEGANGLARIDALTGAVRVFGPGDGYADDLPMVYAIAEDPSGAIWVGFNEGRLLRYRDKFEEVPLRRLQPGQRPPSYEAVSSIVVDRAGRVWLASTAQGLGRIDEPHAAMPAIEWYDKSRGLSSDTARTVVEDLSGHLFIGTGRGIDRFDPATERFTHYSAHEGVPRGEIWGGLRDRTGRIWFATTDGVALFQTRGAERRPRPATLITAIRVAGTPLPIRADGARHVPAFTVQPGNRRVEIDFVTPGARTADGLQYQHRLDGVDQDWTATQARTVTLAGAAPGSYRFVVRSVFANGTETEPATVEFTILAPIWRRPWFIVILALSAVALAYSAYRYRVSRLLELERIRTRIASDLHDDIGAALSRIAVLSEVARHEAGGIHPAVSTRLSVIAGAAREVLDSMNDIVWAINPRHDQLRGLTQRMRRFAGDVFTARGIAFSFRAPDEERFLRVAADVRRHVFLIFKEATNNIVRHAGAAQADVEIRVDGSRLILTIGDNGRGFDVAAERDGNGLANMRDRARAMGGQLEVRSSAGAGTTVTLTARLNTTVKEQDRRLRRSRGGDSAAA